MTQGFRTTSERGEDLRGVLDGWVGKVLDEWDGVLGCMDGWIGAQVDGWTRSVDSAGSIVRMDDVGITMNVRFSSTKVVQHPHDLSSYYQVTVTNSNRVDIRHASETRLWYFLSSSFSCNVLVVYCMSQLSKAEQLSSHRSTSMQCVKAHHAMLCYALGMIPHSLSTSPGLPTQRAS